MNQQTCSDVRTESIGNHFEQRSHQTELICLQFAQIPILFAGFNLLTSAGRVSSVPRGLVDATVSRSVQ